MIIRPLFGGIVVQIFLAVCVFRGEGIPQLFFTTEPSGVTAQQGESVLLTCTASGEQPINITWHRGAEQLHNESGTVELRPNGSLWLQLREGTLDSDTNTQEDVYQCCASNVIGTLCSHQVSVVATAPPSQPFVLPQDLAVVHNASARLMCQSPVIVPQSHLVQWQKDGRDLEDNNRYTLLPDGVLQITQVVDGDAGKFQCMTGNPATSLTTSGLCQLTVLDELDSDASNETTVGMEEVIILEGPKDVRVNLPVEVLVLECLAAGNWVNIEWHWNGGQPLPSGRSRFIGCKNLELTELTADDGGVYTCEATDTRTGKVSRVSAVVEITDYYPPEFTKRPTSTMIRYFATARLYCSAVGNPPPQITWYLNGKLITSSRHVVHESNSDNLVIWNVEKDHEGIYQCFATNALGTIQSSALLIVILPKNRPNPPYNLTTQTVSSNDIIIRWQATEGISLFSLHYYIEPDGQESQKVLVNEDSNMYSVTNLLPYTNYTFYMRAFNNSASGISEKVQGCTAEGVPHISPEFSLTSITANSIIVNWDRITDFILTSGRVNWYRVCYQESGLPREYMCREVSNSESTYVIQGLKAATVYDVHMAVSTIAGFGPETKIQTIRTTDNGNCSVPLMVPLDSAIVLNDTKIELTWSEDSSGYVIQGFRLLFSGLNDDDGIDLGSDNYSYVFSDLLPGMKYTIQLMAYNKCGMGPASTQTLTMPSVPEVFNYPPPENVRATAISSTSIQVNWDPVLDVNLPYYHVIYRPKSKKWQEGNKEDFRTNTFVVLNDLSPFTIYMLQVRVYQSGIIGQYSQKVFCRTKEDVPSAPVDFSAKPLDPHTVSVAWSPPLNPNGVIKGYNIMYVPYTQQEDTLEVPHWNRTRKKGTDTSSTIKNLTSDTTYYFFLRACTSVGEGHPSTVLEVKMPHEINFEAIPGPDGNTGRPIDIEKGLFIGIILGAICIFLCTTMAAIKYKRYHAVHKRKMAARLSGIRGNRVAMSHLARGSSNVEMEMAAMSPMLWDQARHRNGQIHCDSPLLGVGHHHHPTGPNDHSAFPQGQALDGGDHSEQPPGNEQQEQQQFRHTLPYLSDRRVPTSIMRHAPQTCSTSLPESGSEDGTEVAHRWQPLRESTSGDSGLIGDIEFSMEETNPDFVEKVLQEYHIGIHPV